MPSYSNITITTNTGLSYKPNDFVQLSNTSANYIIGRVVSYNSGTGVMVVTPLFFEGSGTFTSWEVNLTGAFGTSGTTGTSGAS